jgi:hypothetical protein
MKGQREKKREKNKNKEIDQLGVSFCVEAGTSKH